MTTDRISFRDGASSASIPRDELELLHEYAIDGWSLRCWHWDIAGFPAFLVDLRAGDKPIGMRARGGDRELGIAGLLRGRTLYWFRRHFEELAGLDLSSWEESVRERASADATPS